VFALLEIQKWMRGMPVKIGDGANREHSIENQAFDGGDKFGADRH